MYLEFYGLREKPFNPTPDPKFLFLTGGHREALAQLQYGVQERRGFMVLTGEVGTGKTTLLQTLLERLDDKTEAAFVFNSTLPFEGILEFALADLGLLNAGSSHAERLLAFQRHLVEGGFAGRNTVLIIDEAQNLTPSSLEQVRLLSNFETPTEKLLQILLVGQPELKAKLVLPELRQLNQRVALRCSIRHLDPDEAPGYVRHRLLVAGAKDPSIFTEAAMTMIGEAAHGVPRLINVVADHCLLMGFSEQKPKVDIELVEKSVGYLRAEGGLTLTEFDPGASGLDWLASGDLPQAPARRSVGGPIFQALVQSEKQRVLRGGEAGAAPRSPAPARFEQKFPDLEATPAPENGGSRPAGPPPPARERALVGRPVDDLQAVEQHLVSLVDPASFEAEQYRTLRSTVEDLRRARGSCIVAVSSAALGEGKTTTSINLAGALAQGRDHRVLLIDADLRRPSVAGQLGLGRNGEQGLVDAIQDPRLGLRDVVRICPAFHLAVLAAGRFTRQPYETLQSPRFGHLLTQARHAFDYVVVDTPPLLPVSDCRLIAEWVDGFLLVIAADSTPRKSVEEALGIIDAEQLIGFVFNRDHRVKAGYYYGYGHA